MKTSFHILTILILASFQTVFGQSTKSDTIYIQKDSLRGFSQSIFIETNKNSKFYDDITSFEFGEFETESYNNSLDYLKLHHIKLKKEKTILPSIKWIPLEQYKGQLYVYHPCDFNSYYKVSINDTTYIDWTGEGPIANKIVYQRKINDNIFEIKTTGIENKNRVITIRIIDKEKGIAIFGNRQVMIMSNKIKSVPFIVHNCEQQKEVELKFEEPNIEKLLKTK